MEKTQWYIGSPNGAVLCVDNLQGRWMEGRLYHSYRREAIRFCNMEQILFELEAFYNAMNYPYQAVEGRRFVEEKKEKDPGQGRVKVMKDEELLERHGDLGTFIIRVQHRQNSSWQGRITWMERDKTLYFRSVWELVKLIAGALDTVSRRKSEEDEPSWTD